MGIQGDPESASAKRVATPLCLIRSIPIFVFLLVFGGCKEEAPQLKTILGLCWPPPKPEIKDDISLLDAREDGAVYLDCSGSMPGYLQADGRSEYGRTLDRIRLLVENGTHCGIWQVHEFGDLPPSPPITSDQFHRATFDQHFYNQSTTRLASLLKDSLLTMYPICPKLTLIVTDGVESSGTVSDRMQIAVQVRQWIAKGGYWGMVGIKSKYFGAFWSECLRERAGKDTALQIPRGQSITRPFYVFIFARNANLLDRVIEHISSDATIGILTSTKWMPTCRILNPDPVPEVSDSISTPTQQLMLETASQSSQDVDFSWWEAGGDRSQLRRFLLQYDVVRPETGSNHRSLLLDWEDMDSAIDSVNCIVWKTDTVEGSSMQVADTEFAVAAHVKFNSSDGNESRNASPRRMLLLVDDSDIFPTRTGWRTYHHHLHAAESMLSPPQWVMEWSTDCDSTLSLASKTLLLSEFVSQILSESTKTPFAEMVQTVWWP